MITDRTRSHARLLDACMYFSENGLHRSEVTAFRLSRGVATLNSMKVCDSSLVIWWIGPSPGSKSYLELDCSGGRCPSCNLRTLTSQKWESARVF